MDSLPPSDGEESKMNFCSSYLYLFLSFVGKPITVCNENHIVEFNPVTSNLVTQCDMPL